MGSSYFGEPNLGNERSGGQGSSSSRKGKKSNSDKPKQPQRGLGVAQLEKIRLHSQMGSGYNIPSLQTPYIIANPNQEDIRVLQTAYSSASSSFSYTSVPSSSSYGFNGAQTIMMGLGDLERANIRYGDSQPTANARWNAGNISLDAQHYQQSSITRHLLNLEVEEKKKKKDRSDSMGSGSQNSGSSGSQELDLELRLSI